MPTVAELLVRINADPSGMERAFSRATLVANRFGSAMQSVGKTLSVAVTAPLALAGAAAVSAAADFDSLRRGTEAITGSVAEASRQIERMKDVAKLPGLGFREAIQGNVRLQAVGISAQNAERYLRAFGNAVALTGGGKTELDRITVQLGQMAGKGRVLAQDMRLIMDAAPVVGRAMREAFGTTDTEAIQRAGLTSSEFLNRLVAQLETLPRVNGGVKNSFENLTDSLYRARVAIGNALLPAIVPLVSQLATLLEKVNTLNPNTVRWGIAIAGVAAVIGPLLLVLGSLTTGVAAFAAALGVGLLPVIAVGGPILIALAALSAMWAKNRLDALNAAAAVEAFKASLVGMNRAQLFLEDARLAGERAGIQLRQRNLIAQGRNVETVFDVPGTLGRNRRFNFGEDVLGIGDDHAVRAVRRATREMQALNREAADNSVRINAVRAAWEALANVPKAPDVTPLNLATAGADKLAGTLDRVGDELRHVRNLMQFHGVIREEDLTEPFQRQLSLVDDLGNRVDTLSDQLSRLGRRAPSEAFQWLARLKAELEAQTEQLRLQAQAWNDLWKSRMQLLKWGFDPQGHTISTVANAPPIVNTNVSRNVDAALGIGTGRLLGDLGERASFASQALAGLREGAVQAGRVLGSLVTSAAGRGGEFAGNIAQFTQGIVRGGQSFAAAAPQALALAAAMEVANSLFSALQPALEALTLPLRIFGEILSLLIVPVLRILFPVFKVIAIVGSYLAETIAKVVSVILNAIGGFVRAIGKVINAIVPFANPGTPLVKAGEALQATAQNFRSAADEMAKKRKELEHLSFDDALAKSTDGLNKLAESLTNVPPLFDLALRRIQASRGTTTIPAPSPPASSGGGSGPEGGFSGGRPIVLNFHEGAIQASGDIDKTTRAVGAAFAKILGVQSDADSRKMAFALRQAGF